METLSSSPSMPFPREPANYDEIAMHQSLLFSDSLKDLKNLRKQLYSAAEYFEVSYTNDDQKQMVVETLKDYAIKAVVNTVDHLGAVSYKVNNIIEEKVDEVSGTEVLVSCIEQRLRTCQGYFDHQGISQQSLLIKIPKYHTRYNLPTAPSFEEMMHGHTGAKLKHQKFIVVDEEERHEHKNEVSQAIICVNPTTLVRKERPPSPSRRKEQERPPSPSRRKEQERPPSPSPRASMESMELDPLSVAGSPRTVASKDIEKIPRPVSPRGFPFPSGGSLSSRLTPTNPRPGSRSSTPKSSRPTSPTSFPKPRQQEPRKSVSRNKDGDGDVYKEADQIPSKGKSLLKALLGRRKSKKDEMLYIYLDEY